MKSLVVGALLILSLAFEFWFCILGLQARAYLTKSASPFDRRFGWVFWWCFDVEKYDDQGKALCESGQRLTVPILLIWTSWFFVL